MRRFWDQLAGDIKLMTLREHLLYWIIPFSVLSVFILFYFSGVDALIHFICPPINWEWGALENIQLLLILSILVISVYAVNKKKDIWVRSGFIFIASFSLFILLEEMDYGTHFVQLIKGGEKHSYLKDLTGFSNIHNQNDNAKYYKRAVYIVMLLIFVIAPFLRKSINNRYISYIIPQPRILTIAATCVVIDLVPRLLVKLNIFVDGGLGVNIGEFSEVMVYYIFLIYTYQLAFENNLETS